MNTKVKKMHAGISVHTALYVGSAESIRTNLC